MKPAYNTLFAYCLLFTICFFSSLSLRAQSDSSLKKKPKRIFYFSPNMSMTNKYIMAGLGFTMMKRNGWGASLEIKANSIQSEQMPKDFEPGGIIIFGDGKPQDRYAFYILSGVKEFQKRNKQLIPGLLAGIAFTEKEIATNFTKLPPATGWFDWGGNYDYEYKKTKSAGVFMKPKLKYVFSKFVATEISTWTIVTPKGSYYGAELSLLIGRIK
jgi:hypothetical protein